MSSTVRFVMLAAFVAMLGWARPADAFCGFYVAGADAKLFNNATLVVMMRDGPTTVLSMQNNYQGPPEDFAMVVPVPVVLQKENVKTLSPAIFDRVDKLAAPRLVEYWEKDPCAPIRRYRPRGVKESAARPPAPAEVDAKTGVKVEAQFEVGEYEIVILSANDSTGLDTWLKTNGYTIPEGAEPMLRPYVEEGSKFFVAKVNIQKVRFEDGQAMLSPLRVHYDTDKFALPVRLGLINASGKQDLIVHILAKSRYDVANYPNATIPTNLDLDEQAKSGFGSFYAKLFDRTLDKNPKAVITEYSWAASSCDPCPSPALNSQEIATLGGDVIEGLRPFDLVLTRLHARYDKSDLGEDLVFRTAEPIAGGRERRKSNQLEIGSLPASSNNFQGRYAIRHPWTGPIECDNPVRGRWGGPPTGAKPAPVAAQKLAFATREGTRLASLVTHDVAEIDLKATDAKVDHPGKVASVPPVASGKPAPTAAASGSAAPSATPSAAPQAPGGGGGCGCEAPGAGASSTGGWSLLALGLLLRRRRPTRSSSGTTR